MGRLSAALKANLDTAVDLWEIDLPDGTTWQMGPQAAPQGSESEGWYEPRVVGFVPWAEQLGDTDNAIQTQTFQMSITDKPGATHSLRDMIGRGDRIQNAPVRRYLAAAGTEAVPVTSADWFLSYSGVLDDWSLESATAATLKIRPDDSAMTSAVLKRKASRYDWPNLPDSNEGRLLPAICGKHSDNGRNSLGAIETFQVDSVAYWYYVSIGRVNVLRVFRAGAYQTPTTHYTVEYPLINGMRHTIVNMVNNPLGDSIRIDVEGHYATGLGTGNPIMASCAVMRHLLSQLVLGEWMDGAWLAESARIHATSWDGVATKLSTRAGGAAYVSAIFLDDESAGYDVADAWLKANHLYAYWRGDGSLGLFMWDQSTAPTIVATLTEADCIPGGFKIGTSKDRQLLSIIAQWGLASGSSRYELEVRNPLALTDRQETVDCTTGPNTWP